MGYLADIQVEEGFWSNRYPGLSWVKADIQVRRDAEGLIRHAEKFAKDCAMIFNDESDPETKWKKYINGCKFFKETKGAKLTLLGVGGRGYTFYGAQFTWSIQLMKPNYLWKNRKIDWSL